MSSEVISTKAQSRWGEFFVESGIRILGFSTIGFVLLIFFFLLREGIPAFTKVPFGNLFGTRWYPTFDLFGMLPLILGSILVTITAIAHRSAAGGRHGGLRTGDRCPTGRARSSSR